MILTLIVLVLVVAVIIAISVSGGGHVETEQDYTAPQDTIVADPPPIPLPISAPASAPENTPTMADFSIAYEIVRGHEAGYQRNPNDRGNYNSLGELVGTNWGINARVYENHLGRPPSISDMKIMPRLTAKAIFKRLYWDRISGDSIPDQQLANIFFDGVVNHGQGVRLMQEVLGVPKDNRYGPTTHRALLAADPHQLHDAYKARRRRYYQQLVEWDASQAVFLRGWLNRIDSFNYDPDGGGNNVLLATVTLATITYLLTS